MKIIDESLATGKVILFENIGETIEPAMEPILNKEIKKTPVGYSIMLG